MYQVYRYTHIWYFIEGFLLSLQVGVGYTESILDFFKFDMWGQVYLKAYDVDMSKKKLFLNFDIFSEIARQRTEMVSSSCKINWRIRNKHANVYISLSSRNNCMKLARYVAYITIKWIKL